MIKVTGKIPSILNDKLHSAGIETEGIIEGGDDLDVTFGDTYLYGIYVGDGKWVVDELDDSSNLFPQIEVGDTISLDFISKLFMQNINSSLIVSFNPLGKLKYGLQDVGKGIGRAAGKVGKAVADWGADRIDADQAQDFLRKKGSFRYKAVDPRDGQTKEYKLDSKGVNVGKVEKLDKMGHYKVLTGNPDTQDFQVWHLYRNGNKIRCLDLKAQLQPQEAQWVYDNDIPKSWTEEDWNPSGEEPESASDVKISEEPVVEEESNVSEEPENESPVERADRLMEEQGLMGNEDNVSEESIDNLATEVPNEESNVSEEVNYEVHDEEIPEESNVSEEASVEDNSTKWYQWKNEDGTVDYGTREYFIQQFGQEPSDKYLVKDKETIKQLEQSSIDPMDPDTWEDNEEIASSLKSNVIESSTRHSGEIEGSDATESEPDYNVEDESEYNGCNVTGCTDTGGNVVLASFICSTLEDFKNSIANTELSKVQKGALTVLLNELQKLPEKDRKAITDDSSEKIFQIDFSKTDLTSEKYAVQFVFNGERVNAKIISMPFSGDEAVRMTIQTLRDINKSHQEQS
jgi:hypothetical protein